MTEDLRPLARAEREDLAAYLATLTPDEWEAPSLCAGWRVRDVVAHLLSYDDLGVPRTLLHFARHRFRFGTANEAAMRPYATFTPEQLLDRLRRHLDPGGVPALMGGGVALTDGMIHHQDVRRPFGRPREIPADRLRPTLAFAATAPPLGAKDRIRGLRLVADDVGWSTGDGPEVRGPGEAVLMAMAGRAAAVPELEGDGVAELTARMQ